MDDTPASLLDQLKKPHQHAAWNRFAELYTPLLYYWARSQGLAETDAADLVQEVFVVLVNKLPAFRYDQDGSFRAWLHAVTVNKHRELKRKKTPIPADDTALLALITLLLMVLDTLAGPNAVSSITTPSMCWMGLAIVPLLEMLKFPCPLPLTPPVKNRSA